MFQMDKPYLLRSPDQDSTLLEMPGEKSVGYHKEASALVPLGEAFPKKATTKPVRALFFWLTR